VQNLASSPRHIIAANNDYDSAYLHHFTGVPTASIPSVSWAGPIYAPSRPEILLSMPQAVENAILPAIVEAATDLGRTGLRFSHIRRLYKRSLTRS